MRRVFLVSAVLALLLAIPGPGPSVPTAAPKTSGFRWDRDTLWSTLEASYREARTVGCDGMAVAADTRIIAMEVLLDSLAHEILPADSPALDSLENAWFRLSVDVAACPMDLESYLSLYGRMRETVKRESRGWDMALRPVRDRLYRALYGGRAALEEVMLQSPDRVPSLLHGGPVPSATPSTEVQGVLIHSGDLLVSRGGYPTSALIARGSDYPGNFSHVALVHVDSTGVASTIEAHIESGVQITTAAEYLGDKKLRIMVLRPHPDLPQLIADPLLPHRAATRALERARAGHIPYDFTMDYKDATRLFCSEVASSVYHDVGLTLWMGLSTISSPGLRRWLASFGVQHFETQEPSDLEYDPQLAIVAEWRAPEALLQDHIDNAVIDAMLEGAERGDDLTYAWYLLPVARVLKGYSWVVQRFGRVGTIPEGMTPTAALRNSAFGARHRILAGIVRARVDSIGRAQGYPPPYWTLVSLARTAVLER